jgi:hypothetical protein
MKEKIDIFCNNYEVKILDNNKRRAKYSPPRYFTEPYRADVIRNDVVAYDTEPVYTLEIPESRLKTLVEMEQRFMNYRSDGYQRDWFEMLMDKEREEAHHRHTNEAVKKAYEQYSLMLHLAGYDKKI